MADYANLKNAIRSAIKANGNNEITGNLLQQILVSMVSNLGAAFQFGGVATQSTNPGTPDFNVAYIAGPGTYQNMGGSVVPSGYIGVIAYNGSWGVQLISVGSGGGGSVITFNSLPNGTTEIRVDGVPQATIPSQYTLLKLSAFTTTPSGLADGSFYYNTSDKKIYQKRDPSVAVIPYYDGAIYTYNNALYVWNGTDLVNVGGGGGGSADFVTEPDDLTLVPAAQQGDPSVLKFANRAYNSQSPNGMGYKILRKDATFASQVTDTNTIYEIRYDFDLNNTTINVSDNCVLLFNGGSIKNGTLNGNFVIDAERVKIFTNIVINKLNATVFPEWFGAFGDGITDCSVQMQQAINVATVVCLGIGTYVCGTNLLLKKETNLIGVSQFDSKLKTNGIRVEALNVIRNLLLMPYSTNTECIVDINSAYVNRSYADIVIKDVTISCNKNTFSTTDAIRIKIDSNEEYYGFYGITIENVQQIDGRLRYGILLYADTSNQSVNPWLTEFNCKDVFFSGVLYSVYCDVSASNSNFLFMNCFFDTVRQQFNSGYSAGYAYLRNISRVMFRNSGAYDIGSVEQFYIANDLVLLGVDGGVEGGNSNVFGGVTQVERFIADNVTFICPADVDHFPPMRMMDLHSSSFALEQSSPVHPCIIPSFWYENYLNTFRGFRITNYTTMSGTRGDSLIGVDVDGWPVCAREKTGNNSWDLRPIYSDWYMPKANADALPSTKRVDGSMLMNLTARIPLWYDASVPAWYNADKVRIDERVTAIRGLTTVREALQLTYLNEGLRFYDENLRAYVTWNGTEWVDANGLSLNKSGTSSQRPSVGVSLRIGFCYFDTTIGKPIWYTGSGWVDATGATV